MKLNSDKIDFKKISELIFFISSFFISGYIAVILIIASTYSNGFGSKFLFDYVCVFVFLCFITFFIHITKFKNNKIHSWINLITLITGCMSYITYSSKIVNDYDLFTSKNDPYSYLYRLLIMILPFLFIFYYLCLAKDVPSSKKKIFFIVFYPVIYTIIRTFLLDSLRNNDFAVKKTLYSMGENKQTIIWRILQLYTTFLLLIPSILGILFIKKEILNKEKIRLVLIYIGCGLVALSFGGFWYPFPLNQKFMKKLFRQGDKTAVVLQELTDYNKIYADDNDKIIDHNIRKSENKNSENKNWENKKPNKRKKWYKFGK